MELKPCPFCGELPVGDDGQVATRHTDGSKWGAVSCCCSGPEVRTGYEAVENWMDDAIAEWNTRPIEDAQSAEIARLTARVAELEGMLREIVDSIPSTYDETDPTVIRHAAALNAAWNRFKEVGRDG